MKIIEAINRIDSLKHNTYTQPEKIAWLSTLDSMAKAHVIDTHEGGENVTFSGYDQNTDLNTVLLIPAPYEEAYIKWLEAQIDYANGEYSKYNNAIESFNTFWNAYKNYYNRTYRPLRNHVRYFGGNRNPGAGSPGNPGAMAQILGMIGDLKKLNTEDKSSLVAAINEVLRKGADPEEVERIVGAYLAENGIGGGIHIGPYPPDDPNVDIWLDTSEEETPPYIPNTTMAKPGQIVRVVTVDENGAIVAVEAVDMPSGGERYELPAATADALGGVKAEPVTEEDTQPVRIGENGMLYTKPGGGVPENGETVAAPLPLLADVTSEEALSHFEVTLSRRAVRRVLVQISVPASEAVGGVCYGALNGGLWDAIIFGNTALAANAKKWMELELMEGGLAKYTVSESSGNLWNLNTIRTAGALEKISYVDSIGIRLLGQNTAPAGTRLQVWGE